MKKQILLKIFFITLVIIFANGCNQLENLSQGRLPKLYPPESTVIKYHTDWTKNHHKERIDEFKRDPLNFGNIVFIGSNITEQGKDWSVKFGVPDIKNRGISGDVTDGIHLNDKGYTRWVELEKSILLNNENNIEFVYPDGNTRALVMSYDDGIVEDLRLIRLFDDNKIVGTFNLNSGYFGTTKGWPRQNADSVYLNYISKDSLTTIYKNHEIAAHGTYHQNFYNITDDEILQEVESDISNLNNLTKRKIKSMAYPFGSANESIAKLISQTGITNARTVNSTYTFDLPNNYLLWNPTCHDSKALDLLDEYLSLNSDTLSVFYVWGHSWEFRDKTRWNLISEFCNKAGNRNDIWYVGCGEFIDYQLSLKALKFSSDFIVNPEGNKQVWFKENAVLKTLKPGEKIDIRIF